MFLSLNRCFSLSDEDPFDEFPDMVTVLSESSDDENDYGDVDVAASGPKATDVPMPFTYDFYYVSSSTGNDATLLDSVSSDADTAPPEIVALPAILGGHVQKKVWHEWSVWYLEDVKPTLVRTEPIVGRMSSSSFHLWVLDFYRHFSTLKRKYDRWNRWAMFARSKYEKDGFNQLLDHKLHAYAFQAFYERRSYWKPAEGWMYKLDCLDLSDLVILCGCPCVVPESGSVQWLACVWPMSGLSPRSGQPVANPIHGPLI